MLRSEGVGGFSRKYRALDRRIARGAALVRVPVQDLREVFVHWRRARRVLLLHRVVAGAPLVLQLVLVPLQGGVDVRDPAHQRRDRHAGRGLIVAQSGGLWSLFRRDGGGNDPRLQEALVLESWGQIRLSHGAGFHNDDSCIVLTSCHSEVLSRVLTAMIPQRLSTRAPRTFWKSAYGIRRASKYPPASS
eukprot:scaffold803_cov310-Pinguiococcus_pyrenoidosus.AAC.48